MTPAKLLLAAALVWAPLAVAQVRPQPGTGDPRLQSIEYRAEQIVTLEVATGYQLALEFAPDERIESVAVGDSGAWLVTPTQRGSHLFIKPIETGAATNMTVVTDARTYLFDLQPLPGPSAFMAYTVRFTYPKADAGRDPASPPGEPAIETRYKVSGDRQLRPSEISDDGISTFIRWPSTIALPAVYGIDGSGRETLVNGMMRDGLYVIDGVSPRLVFRIDRRVARARRILVRESR